VRQALRESGEAALVDPDLGVAVPDALEIDHRRCDIAMTHPLLQRADIDAVLQVARGVGVSKLVKEPSSAERSLRAAVDPNSAVVQLVQHGAVTAVEFATLRNDLQFFQHRAVGSAGRTRE